MDPARRHRYLRALGVEAWVRRDAPGIAVEVEAEAVVVEAPPAPRVRPIVTPAVVPAAAPLPAMPAAEARVAEPPPPPFVAPSDWDGLRAAVSACHRCKLCKTRTNTVFGVGHARAPLMIVGEGPGADEDLKGEPFVGRAGQLLDEMLAAIGRSRASSAAGDAVYIANVVKCRPPGNRDPENDEVEACRPYLEQQIRLIRPALILGLGRIAAQRLLGTDAPLARLRGAVHHVGPERTPLLLTYHPAYLLRSPRDKAKSWEDLKTAWRFLRDASR